MCTWRWSLHLLTSRTVLDISQVLNGDAPWWNAHALSPPHCSAAFSENRENDFFGRDVDRLSLPLSLLDSPFLNLAPNFLRHKYCKTLFLRPLFFSTRSLFCGPRSFLPLLCKSKRLVRSFKHSSRSEHFRSLPSSLAYQHAIEPPVNSRPGRARPTANDDDGQAPKRSIMVTQRK